MAQDDALNFTYDLADQPRSISGKASGTYAYDGNLKRVKSVINGAIVYNIYNAAGQLALVEQEKTVNGVQTQDRTAYVRAKDKTIARVKNGVTTFIHSDHLGSAQVGTDGSGLMTFQEYYTPFGEVINASAENDNQAGFTGHIRDTATGLTYMQARYYDPNIGRFLSIDPMGFDPSSPGSFNRYAYALNDPNNLIDPDGRTARPSPRRPRFRGDNMGPVLRLEHMKSISPLQRINPRLTAPQMGFVQDNASIQHYNQFINDVGEQYNILGRGNLDGSRTSSPNDSGGMLGARIQNVLGNSTFDKNLDRNGFQFNANGGLSDAADTFKFVTGQNSVGSGNANFSYGNHNINVNLHTSTTGGSPTLQINIESTRTGSRIRSRTTVKVRFRKKEK